MPFESALTCFFAQAASPNSSSSATAAARDSRPVRPLSSPKYASASSTGTLR